MQSGEQGARISRERHDLLAKQWHEVVWNWTYTIDQPRVEALYRKSVNEQWNAVHDLDWSATVDPAREILDTARSTLLQAEFISRLGKSQRERLAVHHAAETLSQILHGEQGALLVACRLAQVLPEHEAKLCAAAQAMDEARHLDVFTRYIRKLNNVYPPAPTLQKILEKILAVPYWQAQMVGMQVIVEGIALSTFLSMRNSTECPLLRGILTLVLRDEARHVAFGTMRLKDALGEMHPDDRAWVEDFALELVGDYRGWGTSPLDLMGLMQVLVEVGIDPSDMLKNIGARFAAGEKLDLSPGMRYGLEAIILPGLERLGLISERVRPGYLHAGLDMELNMEALEELQRTLDMGGLVPA